MPDETLEDAIFRLDAAVTRVEAAARHNSARPAPTPPDEPDLVARHAKLRAGTEAAIARLDRLIAAETP